jgi:NADH dehydrogenase
MTQQPFSVVTGDFSYTGGFVARQLLASGQSVKTLTGHPDPSHPYGATLTAAPYDFDRPELLTESLRGATTLYNTYWVRFDRGAVTFVQAMANNKILFRAAQDAGVSRLVHISVTNASAESPLPYFRGKGLVEEAIRDSGLSHAILRPAFIFGPGDILLNNVAWLLRRFPLFAVLGRGDYRMQPIFGEDLARLAIDSAQESNSFTRDAVGPEIFTFKEWVQLIADSIGTRARLVHLPPGLALGLSKLVGFIVRDEILTRDEVSGLMSNLLVTDSPASGSTRFSDWLAENSPGVGARYASEFRRHF